MLASALAATATAYTGRILNIDFLCAANVARAAAARVVVAAATARAVAATTLVVVVAVVVALICIYFRAIFCSPCLLSVTAIK